VKLTQERNAAERGGTGKTGHGYLHTRPVHQSSTSSLTPPATVRHPVVIRGVHN